MKQINILSEKIEYKRGKRIFTTTTETITSLADDIAQLANYQSNLAENISSIERLYERMPDIEIESRLFRDEIHRLNVDVEILRKAIRIQEEFIKELEKMGVENRNDN